MVLKFVVDKFEDYTAVYWIKKIVHKRMNTAAKAESFQVKLYGVSESLSSSEFLTQSSVHALIFNTHCISPWKVSMCTHMFGCLMFAIMPDPIISFHVSLFLSFTIWLILRNPSVFNIFGSDPCCHFE